MKKRMIIISLIVLLIFISISLATTPPVSIGQGFTIFDSVNVEETRAYYHGWTKAIYDGEYLQDYYIECVNDELIVMIPCEGDAPCQGYKVHVGPDWEWPDYYDWQDKWC